MMDKYIILKFFQNIVVRDVLKKNKLISPAEWRNFIGKLPSAQDNVGLSHNKFLCRMKSESRNKLIIGNIISILCFPIVLFTSILPSRKVMSVKGETVLIEKAVSVKPDDIIPDEICESNNVVLIDNCSKLFGRLNKQSKKMLFKCFKMYPTSFLFLYFVYKELVAHSYFLEKYNPSVVVVYTNERNVASPIIKEIYDVHNREFDSFMHGELAMIFPCAFMSFSVLYVWDNSYIQLFKHDLKCRIDEYRVYTPKKLQKKWDLEKVSPSYSYTYYFDTESGDSLRKIDEIFCDLQKKGKKCKYRIHPRNTKTREELMDMNSVIEIEDLSRSLEQSLGETEYAVGLATTVLFEAVIEGRKIIINDITDAEYYRILQESKYRLFSLKHELLSNVVCV